MARKIICLYCDTPNEIVRGRCEACGAPLGVAHTEIAEQWVPDEIVHLEPSEVIQFPQKMLERLPRLGIINGQKEVYCTQGEISMSYDGTIEFNLTLRVNKTVMVAYDDRGVPRYGLSDPPSYVDNPNIPSSLTRMYDEHLQELS